MENKSIITIGGNGLVGTRVQELLQEKYTFTNLSRATGFNITDLFTFGVLENDTEHDVVIHYAAKTNVDGCEEDKALGEQGEAWQINVQGTKSVVEACKKTNKKLIYISTDFVFGGENTPQHGYMEEDTPSPVNWYGETKYQGEQAVKEGGIPYLIVRIAYPYQAVCKDKKDFVHLMTDRLQNKLPIQAITDHMMTPTSIDDIARALDILLEKNAEGIYHVVGSEFISPYAIATKLVDRFHFDASLVNATTRATYFNNRAVRPFNLSLNSDKIQKLGVHMRSFTEGLQEIKL